MIKAKDWKGKDLKGVWDFTFKIDGVRVLIKDGVATSRNGKPLHNIPELEDGDYECYLGNFKKTISAVKTHGGKEIDKECFYSLFPTIDYRLRLHNHGSGEVGYIEDAMSVARDRGYEGLVLRQGDILNPSDDDKWIKVKDKVTHDVKVIGYQAGTGKHEGRMGALLTERGKVGTGFKDVDREMFTEEYIIGKTIEVEAMELTEAGKFRHPRFIHIREDK